MCNYARRCTKSTRCSNTMWKRPRESRSVHVLVRVTLIWTVCQPPTAVSEHAVIQRDSRLSTQLPLSLSLSRMLTASAPSSNKPRKKQIKTPNADAARAHTTRSRAPDGGTEDTSQGIRGNENGFEAWTFLCDDKGSCFPLSFSHLSSGRGASKTALELCITLWLWG